MLRNTSQHFHFRERQQSICDFSMQFTSSPCSICFVTSKVFGLSWIEKVVKERTYRPLLRNRTFWSNGVINISTGYVHWHDNTGYLWSMTRFQQDLKGVSLIISTCGLLQIVGIEKGFFFIYDTWRYLKNCENASDLKKKYTFWKF